MTHRINIDRGSGVAVWRQIAEWLKAEIGSGTFVEGMRLPTETEIAARFGVNRHTVRRAIAELTAEGILRADQGRGTFVAAAPISYPITSRTRFTENLAGQARELEGVLIGSAIEEADALISNELEIAPKTSLVRIDTLRTADGIPLMVGTSWMERSRFPNLVRDYASSGSLTKAIRMAGVEDYLRLETRITAEKADLEDTRLLELEAGEPILVIESVNVEPDGRRMQYTRARAPADRLQLVVRSDA